MFWPALAEAGPFLVMERLACGPTLVVTLAVLFEEFGSAVELETVALLVMLPEATGAVMEIVRVASELPLLSGPGVVQVMTEPTGAPQDHPVPNPLGDVTPPGSVLATVIVPLAGSVPRLETPIV